MIRIRDTQKYGSNPTLQNLPKNQEKLQNLTKKIYNKFSNELVKEPLKLLK